MSSADKLVFDLSQEIEGSPQVFIRKDYLNILDNMNQSYGSNQTIIDTSQLSNSNKWINYREAWLYVPMLMTLTTTQVAVTPTAANPTAVAGFLPASARTATADTEVWGTSADYVLGLKNWFGSVIHSFTLDMQGVTVIQQTPFVNMVNCFRLLTSFSYNDIITQGAVIGFYPDDTSSWSVNSASVNGAGAGFDPNGRGVCNNSLFPSSALADADVVSGLAFNRFNSNTGNVGLLKRIQNINFDMDATAGVGRSNVGAITTTTTYGQLLNNGVDLNSAIPAPLGSTSTAFNQLWVSYISTKYGSAFGQAGVLQISVMGTIYLKHVHNFFAMVPLLKGVFLKMTAFLNNASTNFTIANKAIGAVGAGNTRAGQYTNFTVNVPVGGVNPLMLTSASLGQGSACLGNASYIASLSVGAVCLNSEQKSLANVKEGQLSRSIYLYVPAYTFSPSFEQAYLSSPVKSIKYSDYYQYQVLNVGAKSTFNNLITNGISNIKSVLIIPYYSASSSTGAQASGLPSGLPVYQSPFDPAGAGATSPLCLFSNFNLVISGQNAIYNTEQRATEHFNDWVKGCNSVNGDLTDGLTSGLVSYDGWLKEQCFYYTYVGRQLPVEEQVPKSVQIIGQNQSNFALDLFVFIEYGVAIDIDTLTGARV